MSSSSYLGHGAKYWAEKYFELQTQTRMLDDSSAIEWRDKYLNLEKSCSLYQAKIADLRTEVADLREKNPPKPKPEIFQGKNAEDWYRAYKESEIAYSKLSVENSKNQLEKDTPAHYKNFTAKEWAAMYDSIESKNAELQRSVRSLNTHIAAMNEVCQIDGHDALYWNSRAIDSQKALQREKAQKNLLVFIFILCFIGIFFFGLFLGEGYLSQYFTPSSPYIDNLKKSIILEYKSGYTVGKKDGFSEGYDSGYSLGKKNGYDQGYSAGTAENSKSNTERVTREQIEQWEKEFNEKYSNNSSWTTGDASILRENLSDSTK